MAQELESCAALLQRRFGPGVVCDVVPLAECLEPHGGTPEPHGGTSGRRSETRKSRDETIGSLHPEEHDLVSLAVPARRREFAVGRTCARRLLARLEFAPAPLLCGSDRAPLWPPGAIGSIAHSRSLCAVAVARTGRLAALGLDTEIDEPLEEELWESVCTPRELETVRTAPSAAPDSDDACGRRVRVIFCAKESAYKCIYPLIRRVLEFREVEIEFSSSGSVFRALIGARDERSAAGTVLEGFHFACAGSIFAGAMLRARTGDPTQPIEPASIESTSIEPGQREDEE